MSGGVNGGVNGGVKSTELQLTENATIVLHIVKQDGTLTQKQIAEQSMLSLRSVQRAIKELREKEVMIREGTNKRGKYTIISP
ncbi:MAG: MarR family transcriptional regulator [Sphaerochaetaceae bacterium]